MLADSKAAIAAIRKAGRTGRARSRHLQKEVSGEGRTRRRWKGRDRRAMKLKRKAVTNYCRLRGGKGIGRWWNGKIGRMEGAECPKCGRKSRFRSLVSGVSPHNYAPILDWTVSRTEHQQVFNATTLRPDYYFT